MSIFSQADWIWHAGESQWNETVDFQTVFSTDKPEKCFLAISANTFYAVRVNGEFTANDQFNDYSFHKVFDVIPLSNVKEGENTLEISVNWQGDESSTYAPYEPGLIFSVFEDEKMACLKNLPEDLTTAYQPQKILCGSSENTAVRMNLHYLPSCEKVSVQLSYSFRYDAQIEDAAWTAAKVVERSFLLSYRPVRKLVIDIPCRTRITAMGSFQDAPAYAEGSAKTDDRIASRMQHAFLRTARPLNKLYLPSAEGIEGENWLLADLGSERVGYFELDLEVPEACDVLIGWGEHTEDMRVRTEIGGRNFAALYRAHAGRNHFLYPFKRMGLRYIQLHICSQSYRIYYAGVRPCMYPVEQVHLFQCADHLHNQIYRTSLRTLQNCMHDHYEDCPWREQALYTMDSRNQMLCGYYAFDEYSFARASLQLMIENLREDGLIELCSPGKVGVDIPAFSAIYLIQLQEYLHYSQDAEFVRSVVPKARIIADTFLQRRNEEGLIPNMVGKQYWNFYEWQTGLDGSSQDQNQVEAPLNAFVSIGLASLSSILRDLGMSEEAAFYQNAHEQLNEAMNRAFWEEDKMLYATREHQHFCELTQSLMICADAAAAERKKGLLEKLAYGDEHLKEAFYPITLSHSIFKYQALMSDAKRYGRHVFDQIAKLFGEMLYSGATTFWETSEGADAFDLAGSLCHAWSAVPVWLYMRFAVDFKQEGTKLDPSETGIYEPGVQTYRNAFRNIMEDQYE